MDERKKRLLESAKKFNMEHEKNPLTDINLFSILKMENKEVSAHSAFLYYVFKPFVNQGKRDETHLRLLLKNLQHKLKIFEYDEKQYERVDIQREVVTDFGRLDFLVEMYNDLLIIELKIWAHEQHAQISRYQQYLKSQQAKGEVLFLTPKDRDATTGEEPISNVTLEKEVKNTIEEIIQLRKDNVEYCTVLKQYVAVIDKLSGEESMDEMELLQSAEDILAVDSLEKSKTKVLQHLMANFFETVKEGLISSTENGNVLAIEGAPQALLVDNNYDDQIKIYYEQGKNSYPALIFEITDYKLKNCEKDLKDYRLYFYVEVQSNLYAGLALRKAEPKFGHLEKEEVAEFEKLFKNISSRVSSTFLDWEYVELHGKINFRNFAGDEGWIRKLFAKDSFEFDKNKMQQIVDGIKKSYKEQCHKLLQ